MAVFYWVSFTLAKSRLSMTKTYGFTYKVHVMWSYITPDMLGFHMFTIHRTLQLISQELTCLWWTAINFPSDPPRPPHCERPPRRSIRCAAHSHRSSRLYLDPADRTARPIVSPALDRTPRYLDSEPMSNTKGTDSSLRPYETALGEYRADLFSKVRSGRAV